MRVKPVVVKAVAAGGRGLAPPPRPPGKQRAVFRQILQNTAREAIFSPFFDIFPCLSQKESVGGGLDGRLSFSFLCASDAMACCDCFIKSNLCLDGCDFVRKPLSALLEISPSGMPFALGGQRKKNKEAVLAVAHRGTFRKRM